MGCDGVPGKAKPEGYFCFGSSLVGHPEDLVHCVSVESHGEQFQRRVASGGMYEPNR